MTADSSATGTIQPRIETEHAMAALWKEVLALPESPGAADNFFSLGGDSTAMVMLELRIQEEFSVEVPIGAILNIPSLGALARLIDDLIRKRGGTAS